MAGAQLKLGDLKSAVDTVCSFQDENDRTSALKELAALQIQEGEQEAALEILAVAIETLGGNRTSELAQIATLQAGAGADLAAQSTLTLALEATSNCNDEQERASQVARIAVAMVTAGFNGVAVETAETILTSREQFLPDVAAALVEAKD